MQQTCEICGLNKFSVIATEIREGPGIICQCDGCGLVVQNILQTKEELARYYNEEYQITNSLESGKEQTPREHFENRIKTIGPIVERLRPFLARDLKVLEIGCGAGELLYSIKPYVAKAVGIEMHKGFVDFMNSELDIEAYTTDVNRFHLPDHSFDLIISIMTLDHLPNPGETLLSMKRLLTEKGLLYLEVPNREEALNLYLPEHNRKRFNRFFWHKAHYFYFTKATLLKLMDKSGFSCEVTCRHEYTLMNFLYWYFTGCPQKSFSAAATDSTPFTGSSPFESAINEMFTEMETRFHQILSDALRGDTLCCTAKIRGA